MSGKPPVDLETLTLPVSLQDESFRLASFDETLVQAAGKTIAYFYVRFWPGDCNQSKEDAEACARLFVAAPAMRVELIERRARDEAVERLIAAAGAYYDGYCQDEATDDLASPAGRGFFTGAPAEQIKCAREFRAALAAMRGGAA